MRVSKLPAIAAGQIIIIEGPAVHRKAVAQLLAAKLGLRVDLSRTVSKYIGETEKISVR